MVRKAKNRSYPALYRKRFQLPGLEESVFLYFVVPRDVYCELNIITSSRGAAVELGDLCNPIHLILFGNTTQNLWKKLTIEKCSVSPQSVPNHAGDACTCISAFQQTL